MKLDCDHIIRPNKVEKIFLVFMCGQFLPSGNTHRDRHTTIMSGNTYACTK